MRVIVEKLKAIFARPAIFSEEVRAGLLEHYRLMTREVGQQKIDPQIREAVLIIKAQRELEGR